MRGYGFSISGTSHSFSRIAVLATLVMLWTQAALLASDPFGAPLQPAPSYGGSNPFGGGADPFGIPAQPAVPVGYAQAKTASRQLVPAVFQPKQDRLGFTWDISSSGRIDPGTNRCFSGCNHLQVNGSSFSTSSSSGRKMTRDGKELVLTRQVSGIDVTRRIKVDTDGSTVRYVDVFTNPGSSPVSVTATLGTSLIMPAQAVMSDKGREVPRNTPGNKPAIGDDEIGLVALLPGNIPTPHGRLPSVLFYLAGRGGKVKPTLVNATNNQSFGFAYQFSIPPKKAVAILHGVAQRHFANKPDRHELGRQFQAFQSSKWIRDLPPNVRQAIITSEGTSSESPEADLLKPVTDLAATWTVELSDKDVLVFDDQVQIPGTLSGQGVTVTTEFGETSIPISEIAAIVGAGGQGRPTRVCLQSGEVLVGPLQFQALRFNSESDLQFELEPHQLNVLFSHADSKPEEPPHDFAALVQTRRGDRLALSDLSDLQLSLVTVFGRLVVPFQDIRTAGVTKTPQPVYRLLLNDGSELSALLCPGDLSLQTSRFGAQSLSVAAIAAIIRIVADAEGNEQEDGSDRSMIGLTDETLLRGSFAAPEITVNTAAGETPVVTQQIRSMTRSDDGDGVSPEFEFRMSDGSEFEGRLKDAVVAIQGLGREWHVPVAYVNSFVRPEVEASGDAADNEPRESTPPKKPVPEAPAKPQTLLDALFGTRNVNQPKPKAADPFGSP